MIDFYLLFIHSLPEVTVESRNRCLTFFALCLVSSCSAHPRTVTKKGAGIGIIIGAGAGTLVGNPLIGAMAGAAIGATQGHNKEKTTFNETPAGTYGGENFGEMDSTDNVGPYAYPEPDAFLPEEQSYPQAEDPWQ